MIELFMQQLSCWFFFPMDLLACQFVYSKLDSSVYSAVLNRIPAWTLKSAPKVQPSVGFILFPPQTDQTYNLSFLFQPGAPSRDNFFLRDPIWCSSYTIGKS